MATSSKPVGYECEFIDRISKKCFCKQCKRVAREASTTICCRKTFCKECIETVIQKKGPCPSCQDKQLNSSPSKQLQEHIRTLRVRCSKSYSKEDDNTTTHNHSRCSYPWKVYQCMFPGLKHNHKEFERCEWTGQLQHLSIHTDPTTGSCVFVDIDCPKGCRQKLQKQSMESHLINDCPNRDYTCPKCSDKLKVCEASQHFHSSNCPKCGTAFEGGELEDHIKKCNVDTVKCVFGCEEEFKRNKQREHMELNTQKHLTLMAATTVRISQEQEAIDKKLQQQDQANSEKFRDLLHTRQEVLANELKAQQASFENALRKELSEQQESIHTQLKEEKQENESKLQEVTATLRAKNDQITHLQTEIAESRELLRKEHQSDINNFCMVLGAPPFEITFSNYQKHKREKIYICSPPLNTHPGGYAYFLRLYPNGMEGGYGSHLSFMILIPHSTRPLDDRDRSDHPSSLTITIELLNQHRDQDHITKVMTYESSHFMRVVKKFGFPERGMSTIKFFPLANLGWNEDTQTQYLKDDCLKFRILKQEITSWRKKSEP